jgi:hypothetical protein
MHAHSALADSYPERTACAAGEHFGAAFSTSCRSERSPMRHRIAGLFAW